MKDRKSGKIGKKPRSPGPAADILKIDNDWRDAMKKALEKKRPAGGFPAPAKGSKTTKKKSRR